MITLRVDEEKILLFDIVMEGAESNELQIKFRIDMVDIEIGFPGFIEEDKIKVIVPPLNTIIKEETFGVFRGKLRIIYDNKLYMKPWEDDVELKIEPKVGAQLDKVIEKEMTDDLNVKVKAYLLSAETPKPVVQEEKKPVSVKKPIKNSVLRNKLV